MCAISLQVRWTSATWKVRAIEAFGGAEDSLKKIGEIGLVLKSDRAAVWNFGFDGEAENVDVPIARDLPIADGKSEVVESEQLQSFNRDGPVF